MATSASRSHPTPPMRTSPDSSTCSPASCPGCASRPAPRACDGAALMRLDMRGKRCPLPVIELARRIGDVEVGETLTVVADDPAAASDIAAWCRMRDHEFVSTSDEGDATAYEVRRRH